MFLNIRTIVGMSLFSVLALAIAPVAGAQSYSDSTGRTYYDFVCHAHNSKGECTNYSYITPSSRSRGYYDEGYTNSYYNDNRYGYNNRYDDYRYDDTRTSSRSYNRPYDSYTQYGNRYYREDSYYSDSYDRYRYEDDEYYDRYRSRVDRYYDDDDCDCD